LCAAQEDALDFLEESRLKELVAKYSEFINFPIYLYSSKQVDKEVPIEEEEKAGEESDDDEAAKGEDDDEDEDDEKDEDGVEDAGL
jgi:heat shock protein beta